MNIIVIGTGYVGLVTGTCLAEFGNQVYCVDIDKKKVQMMQNGKIPIYEPGLEKIFYKNLNSRLLILNKLNKVILNNSQVIFLALPTPNKKDGSADLSYIFNIAKFIRDKINNYKVIVNKSTVPVGTTNKIKKIIISKTNIPFDVVSNPEFLREGYALEDFMNPNRLIIGSRSKKAIEIMKKIYKPIIDINVPILIMDEKSAELTKYATNSFLAVKITFINEIANYCEKVGVDIDKVRLGIGSDKRIGKEFLFPGIGYGGSCFPKDLKALIKSGKDLKSRFRILEVTEKVNFLQKKILIPEIKKYLSKLDSKRIAMWGLSFKENTDDIRDASSLTMIKELLEFNANIIVYDPVAIPKIKKIFGEKIEYGNNMYDILDNSDILLISTQWSEFKSPDFDLIASKLKNKVIFDGRNLYKVQELEKKGFYYKSIGRQTLNKSHII